MKLRCVWAEYPTNVRVSDSPYPGYCFEANLPVLQVQIFGSKRKIYYQKAVAFQGHYLAREIHELRDGKPIIDLTVDTIEGLKVQDMAQLTPPADAQPVDLSSIVFTGYEARALRALRMIPAQYPRSIYMPAVGRPQGTVVLHITIEKDGHVDKVKAVSGPASLWLPAVDNVSQWIYMPVVILGEPRAVDLQVRIIYAKVSNFEMF